MVALNDAVFDELLTHRMLIVASADVLQRAEVSNTQASTQPSAQPTPQDNAAATPQENGVPISQPSGQATGLPRSLTERSQEEPNLRTCPYAHRSTPVHSHIHTEGSVPPRVASPSLPSLSLSLNLRTFEPCPCRAAIFDVASVGLYLNELQVTQP
jgi:hypothetical protein